MITQTESFDGDADFVSTKQLVLNLREHLQITQEIHNLLFKPEKSESESLRTINFYNVVKKVLLRSGGTEKKLNLRIFIGLLHELRTKLEIGKAGHLPKKSMREINFGLDDSSSDFDSEKN